MFKDTVSKVIKKEAIPQEVRYDQVHPEAGGVEITVNPMPQRNGDAKLEPERSSLSSGSSSGRSLSPERLSEILGNKDIGDLSEASVAQQQGGAVQVGTPGQPKIQQEQKDDKFKRFNLQKSFFDSILGFYKFIFW